MQRELLKKRAHSIIEIPEHFDLIIEEYFEGDHGEALFAWTNEKEDEEITINLDLAGHLTNLSIEFEQVKVTTTPLNEDARKIRAEEFLLTHYPDALSALTLYRTTEHEQMIRFSYEQIVGELPLDLAGCFIDVDPLGQVIEFRYYGVKPIPSMPNQLVSKDELRDHLQNKLDFKLKVVQMNGITDDINENRLRLVYEPKQYVLNYFADKMTPTITIDFDLEEEDSHTYVPLLAPVEQGSMQHQNRSVEEFIGIPEQMEIIREVDTGDETGIVWRDKNWVKEDENLLVANYFEQRSADTVKAYISNKTGHVTRFMWFKERIGALQLDTDACYQRAIKFLQSILPGYEMYLKRIICADNGAEDEEEEEQQPNETFLFALYNKQDIPVDLEMIIVAVNPTTGQINHYDGPSFDLKQLDFITSEPRISEQEAQSLYFDRVDFQLAWDSDYDDDPPTDRLIYQACDRQTKKKIISVDAITGALILES